MSRNEFRILAINAGSSSIKFALFSSGPALRRILQGRLAGIGLQASTFVVDGEDARDQQSGVVNAPDYTAAVGVVLEWIQSHRERLDFDAVGHRVVHGGPAFSSPREITADVFAALGKISPFAPKHLPEELLLVQGFQQRFPGLPQVACFDTAFHHALPRVARQLPIPRQYEAEGVRRYGFHGLSYAFLMGELSRLDGHHKASGRVILAHLGSGVSLAAVQDGRPIDTSMGLTPAGGVPMGSRSGDLDPGLLSYLSRQHGLGAAELEDMVNFKSGLLGLSETSSDMQVLLGLEDRDPRAAEAIAVFCYQIKKCIGAYAAAMGGVDTLVFAGGIGEQAPTVRARICDGLDFLGIEIDPVRNLANAPVISSQAAPTRVRVIKTDEERTIAELTGELLGFGRSTGTIA